MKMELLAWWPVIGGRAGIHDEPRKRIGCGATLMGQFIAAKSHWALAGIRLRLDMLWGIRQSTVHRAAAPARSFRLNGAATGRDDLVVLESIKDNTETRRPKAAHSCKGRVRLHMLTEGSGFTMQIAAATAIGFHCK